MQWAVIKLPEAKKGFVFLPRRWVVERSFGWAARFRRLACDYERLQRLGRIALPDFRHSDAREFRQFDGSCAISS